MAFYTPFQSLPYTCSTPPRRNSLQLNFLISPNKNGSMNATFTISPLKACGMDLDSTLFTFDMHTSVPSLLSPPKTTPPWTPSIQIGTSFNTFASPIEAAHRDSKQESTGVTFDPILANCHGCRTVKMVYPCHNLHPNRKTHRRDGCELSFCKPCINKMVNRNCGSTIDSIEEIGGWSEYVDSKNTATFHCPKCHGFCDCDRCRRSPSPTSSTESLPVRSKPQRERPTPYMSANPTPIQDMHVMNHQRATSLRRMKRRAPVKNFINIRKLREAEYPNFKRTVSQDMEHDGKCLADETGPLRCIREFDYCTLYNPASDQCGEYDRYEID